jgi:hypothetical protein
VNPMKKQEIQKNSMDIDSFLKWLLDCTQI